MLAILPPSEMQDDWQARFMPDIISYAMPYAGLFAISFLAATIVPAQSELILGAMLLSGRYDPVLLLVTATAGNTLGSCVNWLLGRFVEHFRESRWFPVTPAQLARAEEWYAKWGRWSLLLSWVPAIGDGLTLAAGILRTPFSIFFVLVLIAKGGRYLALAGALGMFA